MIEDALAKNIQSTQCSPESQKNSQEMINDENSYEVRDQINLFELAADSSRSDIEPSNQEQSK